MARFGKEVQPRKPVVEEPVVDQPVDDEEGQRTQADPYPIETIDITDPAQADKDIADWAEDNLKNPRGPRRRPTS